MRGAGLLRTTSWLGPVLLGTAAREWWLRRREVDLEGQVVVITGGSRGLGLVLAREFGRLGARVAVCARDDVRLERARRMLAEEGIEVFAMRCDVGDRDQVRAFIDATRSRLGPVDVLINNAGIVTMGPIDAQTIDDFQMSMDAMFWGPLYTVLEVLPEMRARRSGRIVNITSIGGKVAAPHMLPYVAAKWAATGLSEGLHAELRRDGIQVTTVVPGFMRTGSYLQAMFSGSYRREFDWFSTLSNSPLTSISAPMAARRIVRATRRAEAEVTVSPQAQLATRLHGLMPGVTLAAFAVWNWMLPRAEAPVHEQGWRRLGMDSKSGISGSFLNALGERAARAYNQYPPPDELHEPNDAPGMIEHAREVGGVR